MPLVEKEIEFQPGDEIFTTDILSDDLQGEGAYATVSEVYENMLLVYYGVYTDFCQVRKNSCFLVKKPANPNIMMPNNVGFF